MSETYYYAAAMSIQGMEASAMPRRPSPEPKRNTHTQAAAMASQTTLVAPTSTQKLEDDDASIQKNHDEPKPESSLKRTLKQLVKRS